MSLRASPFSGPACGACRESVDPLKCSALRHARQAGPLNSWRKIQAQTPMFCDDTIAAISSAVGPAPRMIVRASGPLVREILATLTGNEKPDDPSSSRVTLNFADLRLPAWAYLFLAPRS